MITAFRAGVAACALVSLAGCAAIQQDATSFENFVNSPSTQETVATLKVVSTALVCDVASGSALAKTIEASVNAHQGVTSLIAVSSATVCAALQGTLTGATVANTNAVISVATPASAMAAARYRQNVKAVAPKAKAIFHHDNFVIVQE